VTGQIAYLKGELKNRFNGQPIRAAMKSP